MTKNEVIKILAICKGAGVNFGEADNNVLIEIWINCFKDNSYSEVAKALFELIQSKEPLFVNGLIGRIKEKIIEKTVDFLDFPTAWEILRTAMRKTHPDIPQETQKAFDSLPPILQHLVGSPRHLEDMEYKLDRHELETVERSNMKKLYADLITKTKELLQLGKTPYWLSAEQKKELSNGNTDKLNNLIQGCLHE